MGLWAVVSAPLINFRWDIERRVAVHGALAERMELLAIAKTLPTPLVQFTLGRILF